MAKASFIITQVRRELVETVGSFWSDAELLDLINRGERDFVNKTRILDDISNLDTVVGQANYPLPANWLSARAIFYNNKTDVSNPDNWQRVRPTNLEKQAQERVNLFGNASEDLGPPSSYWIWGRELYLDRTPDRVNEVKLFYKSKAITLNDSDQELNVDDSLDDGIQSYVLWKAWRKEKEFNLAKQAKDEYLQFIGEGRRWVKKQSGDQRFRIDIDSPRPFSRGSSAFDPFQVP